MTIFEKVPVTKNRKSCVTGTLGCHGEKNTVQQQLDDGEVIGRTYYVHVFAENQVDPMYYGSFD